MHGRFLLTDPPDAPAPDLPSFAAVMARLQARFELFLERIVGLVNYADASHSQRRYPLMSLFMADCIDRGLDVCAGGARYNLTGIRPPRASLRPCGVLTRLTDGDLVGLDTFSMYDCESLVPTVRQYLFEPIGLLSMYVFLVVGPAYSVRTRDGFEGSDSETARFPPKYQ